MQADHYMTNHVLPYTQSGTEVVGWDVCASYERKSSNGLLLLRSKHNAKILPGKLAQIAS